MSVLVKGDRVGIVRAVDDYRTGVVWHVTSLGMVMVVFDGARDGEIVPMSALDMSGVGSMHREA